MMLSKLVPFLLSCLFVSRVVGAPAKSMDVPAKSTKGQIYIDSLFESYKENQKPELGDVLKHGLNMLVITAIPSNPQASYKDSYLEAGEYTYHRIKDSDYAQTTGSVTIDVSSILPGKHVVIMARKLHDMPTADWKIMNKKSAAEVYSHVSKECPNLPNLRMGGASEGRAFGPSEMEAFRSHVCDLPKDVAQSGVPEDVPQSDLPEDVPQTKKWGVSQLKDMPRKTKEAVGHVFRKCRNRSEFKKYSTL